MVDYPLKSTVFFQYSACHTSRQLASTSVYNLIVIIELVQVRKYVVRISATEVAKAGINPHHLPGQHSSVGTTELYLDGLGLVWDATAVISSNTYSTVLWPVSLGADTA